MKRFWRVPTTPEPEWVEAPDFGACSNTALYQFLCAMKLVPERVRAGDARQAITEALVRLVGELDG